MVRVALAKVHHSQLLLPLHRDAKAGKRQVRGRGARRYQGVPGPADGGGVQEHQARTDLTCQQQLLLAERAAPQRTKQAHRFLNLEVRMHHLSLLHRYGPQPPLLHHHLPQQTHPRAAVRRPEIQQEQVSPAQLVVFQPQPGDFPGDGPAALQMCLGREGGAENLQLADKDERELEHKDSAGDKPFEEGHQRHPHQHQVPIGPMRDTAISHQQEG